MTIRKKLPDTQAIKDTRGITINRVGVEGIHFPLLIASPKEKQVLVYSTIDLYGSLRHQVKGTNMSRFLETLMEWKYKTFSKASLHKLLMELRDNLGEQDTRDVYIKIKFDYFLHRISPVSKKQSVMMYPCVFIGLLRGRWFQFQQQVKVLTTSVCPCSKAISKYGAHNQRSVSTVIVESAKEKTFWLEQLIPEIEQCGSCEIYPLLKREDEKYVTERGYENPKFVEDIARDISAMLQNSKKVRAYKVKVSNEESIHQHNAVAYIARNYTGGRWRNDIKTLRG